jgi:hypothetical protein
MDIKIGFNQETIGLAIFIVGAIYKAFVTPRMNAKVVSWINKVGGTKKLMELIKKADEFCSYSNEQKHDWVYNEIQKIAKEKLGFEIPKFILDEAIKFIVTQLRLKDWKLK